MNAKQIKQLALLRIAVGLLGEQVQPRWWISTFCGANGKAFLAPVFPRTQVLAQLHGVSAAAAIVHDDHIGVGNAFHLFRLPEDLEQEIHGVASGEAVGEISDVMHSADSAMQFIKNSAARVCKDAVGPVKVGQMTSLREASSWRDVAAFYLSAFEGHKETFPFFSDRT
jgi:hypothetical protein